jgi:pullulanase-type alpha-1,6-glucosidase
MAWLVLAGAAAQAEDSTALRQACDAPSHATVLRADAGQLPAAALWLDATRLQWPGAAAGARHRLLHAPAGGIDATPGQPARGAALALPLLADASPLSPALQLRHRHLSAGVRLALAPADASPARLQALHRGQLLLVQEDDTGRVLQATRLQAAAALDDLYAPAQALTDLGVATGPPGRGGAQWRLWAPTAQGVWLCLHASDSAPAATTVPALQRDDSTGSWQLRLAGALPGRYYRYLVDVWVPGTGLVRQRVSDPYAISLGTDGRHAWVGSLDEPATQPPGWRSAARPAPRRGSAGLAIYELHVRDFSRDDASVPAALRGKYGAFSVAGSLGMRHLRALARAGLTDVHLLPVFDIASVPEAGCATPAVHDLVKAAPDSPAQQAAVMAQAASDCFNWGYDPLHFNAPEGSYASRADDGATRIRELRQMVMALHAAGLRVGMDVVYNHMAAAGQHPQSVLDRTVPGYYHRLDAQGAISRSTCCDNTATEHPMMTKLMRDSVRLWARAYRIDSFRFDLMGHQPRAAMVALQQQLRADNGRDIQLIGEGWNFGEVADGARFVQAAQGALAGTGIATFSDRARDALRGGGVGDGPAALVARQGWLNGLAEGADPVAAAQAADLLRLGLAGTLHGYRFTTHTGEQRRGDQIVYAGQPAGYADAPGEVVNYVENHDNHTLWDLNAFKLPLATSADQRARVQVLALASTAFSQGVAYFHAGVELLRSKSMDGNSYDSGDWFNRIDWSGASNHFGSGLPPAADNQALWPLIAPRLADVRLQPAPADIAWARGAFLDLLRIRAGSSLFRLDTAAAVQQRLHFHNTGPAQNPALVVAELDGRGLAGAGFRRLLYALNASVGAQSITLAQARGQPWVLHPVQRAAAAADRVVATQAAFDPATGRFSVPGRSAAVFVLL